jgi:hypothetical protein
LIGLAQNLVPNPSFEITDCDAETDEYFFPAMDWYNVTNSSPDYYSISLEPGVCFAGPPTGNQIPRTGSFMAGLWGSQIDSPTREYIQAKLISPLEADSVYCIEMHILLAEFCPLAINRFGVQLSTDSLYDYSTFQLLTGGTLFSSSVDVFLSDAENWIQLIWEYQATGGEEFMTLGNFWAESDLEYMDVEGSDVYPLAYYYVDDVSIVNCGTTSLYEEEPIGIIGPNPFDTQLEISIGVGRFYWALYSMDGRQIRDGRMVNRGVVELSDLSSGLYIIQVQNSIGEKQSKVVCKQ